MPERGLFNAMDDIRRLYPEKFASAEKIFSHIRRGDRIFIGTGCGEPQHLVHAFIEFVRLNPKAFLGAQILHIWALGVTPYADEKFQRNFRYNSFFVGNNIRDAVNRGAADYTPIFLSEVPGLLYQGMIPIDIALIQTSPPDEHGYFGMGVSVDIVKAAVETAALVIAQVNTFMPRTSGDGFIHLKDVDFIVPYDEPLLEYTDMADTEIAQRIAGYVARLINDGDTLQVGYGSLPNAILSNLNGKKHLGIHTELLTDGIVELMKKGVIDNSQKSLDRGKTVATFCMGKKETYSYIHNNPAIEFRTADYTNNPLIIAKQRHMVAINSALQIDLTGQASAESIGSTFYSGIGGQADFMRGAVLAPGGQTILTIPSTAEDGNVSRIVPFLSEGAGVTLNRGDIQYVVTEYGIAYLKNKSVRERAMELIAIAHPRFRPWLIEEAKTLSLIYKDQAFIPGERGDYPAHLETYRTTKMGLEILLRPVKISDEPLLNEFFHKFSDESLYLRFFSIRQEIPREFVQKFVAIDYTRLMVVLAILQTKGKEEIIAVGQYWIQQGIHTGNVAFAVRDDYQKQGVGTVLLSYLTYLAKKQGLHGFTAEVLADNKPMLNVFKKGGFEIHKRYSTGHMELEMNFKQETAGTPHFQ